MKDKSENNNDREKTYLSQEKLEELKKELEYLKTTRRKEIADQLVYAKSLGDLSENSEYQEAREEQERVESRIATVDDLLRSATIISGKRGDVVDMGSTVTIQKKNTAEDPKTYYIVGSEEADIAEQKISNKSPLGAALIGKRAGESVLVSAPNGEVEYKVIKME